MAKKAAAKAAKYAIVAPATPAPVVVHRTGGGGGGRAKAALARLKARTAAVAARARRTAHAERHMLVPVAGAAALGLLRRFAPGAWTALSIGPLTPPAVIGIAGYLAGHFGLRNDWVRGATTAGLAVAAFDYASGGGTRAVSGDEGPVFLPTTGEAEVDAPVVTGDIADE